MKSYLPEEAIAFRDFYARAEHVLRRTGYLRTDRKKAETDWVTFATEMGQPFFAYVSGQRGADTLITEPPRALHRDGSWLPKIQQPIDGTVDLFVRGVCQVRHNIVHGEKFIVSEGARSCRLVKEAHWVLKEAIDRHHDAAKMIAALGSTK
jgi:hypothetical protein